MIVIICFTDLNVDSSFFLLGMAQGKEERKYVTKQQYYINT